ncbi:MAG TPA: asparagine synthase-related protein, partial [Planctomycetota bacterium]|nr:asparagine synthase-related protein [Planctomycetota bacterium]
PFLDPRVVAFANGLPARRKLAGLLEKPLLRRVAADLLPPEIARRPKLPYRAPESRAFFDERGEPADYVADLLGPARLAEAGLFDPPAVGRLVEKCRRGEVAGFGDNAAFVAILSTMLLHDQFVRRAARPGRAAAATATETEVHA